MKVVLEKVSGKPDKPDKISAGRVFGMSGKPDKKVPLFEGGLCPAQHPVRPVCPPGIFPLLRSR